MKYLVSYSGGKDSTATLLWAYENLPTKDINVAFCDTGWETKTTYDYIDYIEDWCKTKEINFYRIIPPMQFEKLILYKKTFPRHGMRYCTQLLKIKHFFTFLQQLRDVCKQDVVVLVGERADESPSRAQKSIVEFNDYHQSLLIRPIFYWDVNQVFDMHKKHNVKHNEMYDLGFTRVGCSPCIFANKNDIKLLVKHFPEQVDKIRKMEEILSSLGCQKTFFNINKIGKNRVADIDTIVKWATGGYTISVDEILEEQYDENTCKASYGILCE